MVIRETPFKIITGTSEKTSIGYWDDGIQTGGAGNIVISGANGELMKKLSDVSLGGTGIKMDGSALLVPDIKLLSNGKTLSSIQSIIDATTSTIYVRQDASPGGTGGLNNPVRTLNEALSKISSTKNYIHILDSKIYEEDLDINNVNLVAIDGKYAEIKGNVNINTYIEMDIGYLSGDTITIESPSYIKVFYDNEADTIINSDVMFIVFREQTGTVMINSNCEFYAPIVTGAFTIDTSVDKIYLRVLKYMGASTSFKSYQLESGSQIMGNIYGGKIIDNTKPLYKQINYDLLLQSEGVPLSDAELKDKLRSALIPDNIEHTYSFNIPDDNIERMIVWAIPKDLSPIGTRWVINDDYSNIISPSSFAESTLWNNPVLIYKLNIPTSYVGWYKVRWMT